LMFFVANFLLSWFFDDGVGFKKAAHQHPNWAWHVFNSCDVDGYRVTNWETNFTKERIVETQS
jgi:hypothetical protein